MKKIILVSTLILTMLTGMDCPLTAGDRSLRRVTVIATGGTIAGTAESSTQDAYQPAQLTAEQILATIPDIDRVADISTIQLCNIASQNMTEEVWMKLLFTVDSLFTRNLADGVVVTHGTDTMEETAYFLHLTLKHDRPVVLTGAMRPATAINADGPNNLYNAISLAADENAVNKGVMCVMNNSILSAENVKKMHTTALEAFKACNSGVLGHIRDGKADFYREPVRPHTVRSGFVVGKGTRLPKVEIALAYAFSSGSAVRAYTEEGAEGIVIAGVGHGNCNETMVEEIGRSTAKGVVVVRSSHIVEGGVDLSAEEYSEKVPVCFEKSPQQSRILLMLCLLQTRDPRKIQEIFKKY